MESFGPGSNETGQSLKNAWFKRKIETIVDDEIIVDYYHKCLTWIRFAPDVIEYLHSLNSLSSLIIVSEHNYERMNL